MSERNRAKPVSFSVIERRNLLSTKLNELSLKIRGSHLEICIDRIYAELDKAGITFRPGTYLSDGWGCPSGVPIIGIPFYLADPTVYQAVNEFIDPAPWDDAETIRYLRHEYGHALNYACRLYKEPDWEKTFGLYSKPYEDNYKSVPFDNRFVRHSAGWYAQKHPDEDFAETFAVWLDPDSNWREVYADTPALPKLFYIDSIVEEFGGKRPEINGGELDRPLNELDITLAQWCRMMARTGRKKIVFPSIVDEDLKRLFPDAEGDPAVEFLEANRRQLIRAVHDWTGVSRDLLNSLIRELTKRVKVLGLRVDANNRFESMVNTTAFVSTLAMNYQYNRRFID
jgi:hypothetical protein